ncbi:sigma-70 family RNA polymerase sigma factor [Candidatus Poribacteria bacterium]|nr:sigma-70 family RNA polymerase sigma factor [Candidatus Poribacteria bacterium]MYA57661.1 sigma-70 family RNA polymerase sigma factor [Candidatus Poribacteria bacterium]
MGKKGQSSYTHDILERCETNAYKYRYQLVQQALKKLPESERTIIVLCYLGEMAPKQIGNFLGVSANTIARRLQRAHKFLQKDEILLIQKVLGDAQVSGSVHENLMRQVPHIKSKSHSVRKRFFLTFLTILVIAIIVVSVLKLLNIT